MTLLREPRLFRFPRRSGATSSRFGISLPFSRLSEPYSSSRQPHIGLTDGLFFVRCVVTEPDRHAVPVLTVLPLLTGERQEEGDGVKNEET